MREFLKVVGVFVLAIGIPVTYVVWQEKAHAQSLPTWPQAPKSVTVKLPPKTKLAGGVSWHCQTHAVCEPWYTTRAMRSGEAVETYVFTNLDGREYVVSETTD